MLGTRHAEAKLLNGFRASRDRDDLIVVTEIVTTTDLDISAANLFVAEMLKAIEARSRFCVALSGGSTPLGLFATLSRSTCLPWDKVHVFWGDERFVPHDHDDSNYRAARKAFLSRLPFGENNIHPWPAPTGRASIQEELADAATTYSRTLKNALGASPVFDLQLLGLGSDGHTASLYPLDPAIYSSGLTASATPPGVPQPRLTLTPSALSSSRCVTFLVSGESKRAALEETLASDVADSRYPARWITALERLVWLTDLQGTKP